MGRNVRIFFFRSVRYAFFLESRNNLSFLKYTEAKLVENGIWNERLNVYDSCEIGENKYTNLWLKFLFNFDLDLIRYNFSAKIEDIRIFSRSSIRQEKFIGIIIFFIFIIKKLLIDPLISKITELLYMFMWKKRKFLIEKREKSYLQLARVKSPIRVPY